MLSKSRVNSALVASVAAALIAFPATSAAKHGFITRFGTIGTISSAVPKSGPAMGDQNPYGLVVVPRTVGKLVRGDTLISNFNNSQNLQGTGSSIVEISPSGSFHVFAIVPAPTSTPAVGLTTALAVLRSGYVVVGSLPAPGGKSKNARAGALTILNSNGHVVKTISGGDIKGPWDMTAVDNGDHATLFVTNVLNGTVAAKGSNVKRGTVVRIELSIANGKTPAVTSNQVIATGFTEHTDPNALVVGPTGVGLGNGGTLFVADSANNRIAAIPHAMTRSSILGGGGNTVASGGPLSDPLGLTITPGGDVITANGADGNLVETAPNGHLVATKTLVANGGGDLFGIAVAPGGTGLYFVDDAGMGPASNSLQLLH
jgi:hypothetical protein